MKYSRAPCQALSFGSRPARGEWIEIQVGLVAVGAVPASRPARGEWIEIRSGTLSVTPVQTSRPARGEWIEIPKGEGTKGLCINY